MKKTIALLLAVVMMLALCACGNTAAAPSENASPASNTAAEPAPASDNSSPTYIFSFGTVDTEEHPSTMSARKLGEILNEKLWVDALDAGADGIILKSGELLTRSDVGAVLEGKQLVFNEPILKKIVERFKRDVTMQLVRQEALVNYEIDEYDERFLRHLALGYTKEQITNLRGMPFGVKSLEKRQNELVHKLFPEGESVNATRLVVRALELRILDLDNLEPDAE